MYLQLPALISLGEQGSIADLKTYSILDKKRLNQVCKILPLIIETATITKSQLKYILMNDYKLFGDEYIDIIKKCIYKRFGKIKKLNDITIYHIGKFIHKDEDFAVIYSNGSKRWYKAGLLHRIDGPAVIHSDGRQIWYKWGKIHRDDGPALTFKDGIGYWYFQDQFIKSVKI